MEIQTIYQKTIKFAAEKHEAVNQKIPGTEITYLVHLSNVAMEIIIASTNSSDFDLNFAIQVALLHDTLEDTQTTFEEIQSKFGENVANAVQALTKDSKLKEKLLKMEDSLKRIKLQPKEVWAVKLADRITNLQTPPLHWSKEKIENYSIEAEKILSTLNNSNPYLEERLKSQIKKYKNSYVS